MPKCGTCLQIFDQVCMKFGGLKVEGHDGSTRAGCMSLWLLFEGLIVVCWWVSLGEDEIGAKVRILSTRVAHVACAKQTLPHGKMGR